MKITKADYFNLLGIGAFLFLSIQQFSSLVVFVLRYAQSVLFSGSKEFLWLPELIGLIVFTLILLWTLHRGSSMLINNPGKLLLILVILFFGITLLQILFPIIGAEFMVRHAEEFADYSDRRKNLFPQLILGLIKFLYYLVFLIVLFLKRKTVVNIY
ncbi:hypothetical protein [Muriicola sp.]|uniref:hypothetical protein n=1 Tax=Muriicola sp. TaxID=2020856 RepID=UPI003C77183B